MSTNVSLISYFLRWFAVFFIFSNSFVVEANLSSSMIFYLCGTCSSGKSTFIQTIKDPCDLIVVDEDSIMQKKYVDAVVKRFPNECDYISRFIANVNLYHALREKDILFNDEPSEGDKSKVIQTLDEIQRELNQSINLAWKQKISQEINEEVLFQLKGSIEQNNNIILDSWYVKEDDIKKLFPNVKIIKILLFCPFHETFTRFLNRNEEAIKLKNLQEKRYFRQFLGTFAAFYKIDENPQTALQKIYKAEIDQIFDEISLKINNQECDDQKPIFTFNEIAHNQFLKIKNLFYEPFMFSTSEFLYLSPRKEYDLIVDARQMDQQTAILYLQKWLTVCP